MMKARRRKILVVILLRGGVAASIAATVGRPYARICWMLGLGESTYYGWHTNLQDVTIIRHDKKIDLRVTSVEARMRA